ncbi:MAG: hypothetical protein JWN76_1173 [Chitinophagaceae bacterium]|nr:hypothetical protein [Chitinophagaceae bacterium]
MWFIKTILLIYYFRLICFRLTYPPAKQQYIRRMITKINSLANIQTGYILIRLDSSISPNEITDDLFKQSNEFFLITEVTPDEIKLKKAIVDGRIITYGDDVIQCNKFFDTCCWFIQTKHFIPNNQEQKFIREIHDLKQEKWGELTASKRSIL